MTKLLSIGMATYDDFHGVYFTIQALRMYHAICATDDVELIILDNNPEGTHGQNIKNLVSGWMANKVKYIPYTGTPSTFNKYKIVDYAEGKYIMILDCHVMLVPGSIEKLLEYYKNNPGCKDIIQGPLLYDDLNNYATEFKPEWRDDMYGIWHSNREAYEKGEPFNIALQGMGMCSFEKTAWPGISPHFRGFGGEEGYIHEKFRQNGGRAVCIPQLKWVHRFGRPDGVKYPLALEDRIWNYFIGWLDITKDPQHHMIISIIDHFKTRLPEPRVLHILDEAKRLILP